MKSTLKRIVAAALPVVALGVGAASLDARADDPQDQLAGFVGKPVYDANGAHLGNIMEVVVADLAHGNQTVALVAGLDGGVTTIPLGETDTLIATVSASQIVAYEEASPVLISPDYITPESRGS